MRFLRHPTVLLTLSALALLTGCGVQGNPLPPSLELPRPVRDLKAARKGDKVLLAWTVPRETTDKLRIKAAVTTRACRATAVAPASMECTPIPEAPPGQASATKASYTDMLPREFQEQHATGLAAYTIEVVNARGRSAGPSNAVRVPLAPTLPPPSRTWAAVEENRITIRGTPVSQPPLERENFGYALRLYRRGAGQSPASVAAQAPVSFSQSRPISKDGVIIITKLSQEWEMSDASFEWEKTYTYWLTLVTIVRDSGGTITTEVEGEDSPPVEVLAHDVFPPAAPTAVQAVAVTAVTKTGTLEARTAFIDLTWTLNSEADLTGYNVYRHEAGAQLVKINGELVKTPAFRDASVTAGHTYLYTVTAVDLRSNESGRSEETSETVPQP